MSIKSMKQALEALKWINDEQALLSYSAVTTLRTAIEEAEKQERNFCERCGKRLGGDDHIHTCTPPIVQRAEEAFKSAKKREWVGLTDKEIWAEGADNVLDLAFARDIEAKLKEKNT